MTHVRKQIRDATVDALAGVGTVYASRVYNLEQATLPVVLVYSGAEQIEGDFSTLSRQYQVIIEAIAEGTDDALDALIVQIEDALTGELEGQPVHMQPVSIDIVNSADGSAPIGRARIIYEALYRTSYADPETPL